MKLSRLFLTALMVIASTAPGLAQIQRITVASEPSPEQIKAWLGSTNPLEVAWGAWFASETADGDGNDDSYATIMAQQMTRWMPGSTELPIRAILYALIEKNESVPALSLESVARKFPTEALILAARLHGVERTQFLERWYETRNDESRVNLGDQADPLPKFSGIAAMLLSKTPPPGLAASVVAESEEKLAFWLADSPSEEFRWYEGPPSACKDKDQQIQSPRGMEDEVREWPPLLFQYQLQTRDSPESGRMLVDVGGFRIGYRRISIFTRPSYCFHPGIFTNEFRHHILAELLGLRDDEMPWQAQERQISFSVCSETSAAVKKQIGIEESKLGATVQALYARGLLTKQEAKDVRPRLAVTAIDIRSCSKGRMHSTEAHQVALSMDPRTAISFDSR